MSTIGSSRSSSIVTFSIGETVAARHGEHDLVAEERLEDNAAVAPLRADDAELELAARDLLDHMLRVRHRERDAYLGMEPLELAEHDRQDGAAGAGGGADLEAAGELALRLLAQLGEELLLLREQPLRAPVQPLARLRRLDAAAGTVEQLAPEPLLERSDLKAHRRLRHAELFRRLREAPPLDDGAESRELPRVHIRPAYLCLLMRAV